MNIDLRLKRLNNATYDTVKHAFFANYLVTLLMLRLNDKKGIALGRDLRHISLENFSEEMSDVAFWGRALFYPDDEEVRRRLPFGHAEALAEEAGRISDSFVAKVMKVTGATADAIDWHNTVDQLHILRHRFELKSSYFDQIVHGITKWDSLDNAARNSVIGSAYIYLLRSDSKSALLTRIRELRRPSLSTTIAELADRFASKA